MMPTEARPEAEKVIITTYTYVPNRNRLDRLLAIKDQTGVAVARQIDFAIDRYLREYQHGPRPEQLREELKRYARGEGERKRCS